MRVVFAMFDSLNRKALEPYGGTTIATPAFNRLAERAVTFDRHYIGSMPCMPARRDLLTGRRLRLEGNDGFRYGRALSIEDDGGLKVDIDGYGPQVLYAADVSIQYD